MPKSTKPTGSERQAPPPPPPPFPPFGPDDVFTTYLGPEPRGPFPVRHPMAWGVRRRMMPPANDHITWTERAAEADKVKRVWVEGRRPGCKGEKLTAEYTGSNGKPSSWAVDADDDGSFSISINARRGTDATLKSAGGKALSTYTVGT